jgi:hypothetical protein
LTLDDEARFEIFACQMLSEDLDCDLLGEDAVCAVSQVDATHAATAEEGSGLVDAEAGKTLHLGQSLSMEQKRATTISLRNVAARPCGVAYGFNWISDLFGSKGSNFF